MIFHAVVDEPFTVYDYFDNSKVKSFKKGDIIEYERYDKRDANPCGLVVFFIRISYGDMIIRVPDFIIEGYVTNVPEPLTHCYTPKKEHVQIQRIEGQGNANNFLLSIPRENIIDIKPMEHNTYLVIYTEEEHEENKV